MTVFGMLLWEVVGAQGWQSLLFQTAQIVLHKACMSAQLLWLHPSVSTLPNRQHSRACFQDQNPMWLLAGLLLAPALFGRPTTSQLDRHYNMSNVKQLQHGVTSRLTAARLEKKSKHRLRSEN